MPRYMIELDEATDAELKRVGNSEPLFGYPEMTVKEVIYFALDHIIGDRDGHIAARKWRIAHRGESMQKTAARLGDGDSERPPAKPVKKTRRRGRAAVATRKAAARRAASKKTRP